MNKVTQGIFFFFMLSIYSQVELFFEKKQIQWGKKNSLNDSESLHLTDFIAISHSAHFFNSKDIGKLFNFIF